MSKKISELPPAQAAAEANAYPVVQSADTRRQTLTQLRAAISGAWSATINTLLLAADGPAARTALGLRLQSSISDTTAGSVLTVGAFGLMGGPAIPMAASTDVNTLTTPGLYAITVTAVNAPETAVYVWVFGNPAGRIKQFAFGYSTSTVYYRSGNVGTYSPWEPIIPGAMTAFTFANSWVNFSGRRSGYRRSINGVEIELNAAGGTATNGTIIATLPAGFRPPSPMSVPVASFPAVAPSTSVPVPCVVIGTDGTITCQNCTNTLIGLAVKFSLV